MKVVSKKVIDEFIITHPDGANSIRAWYHEALNATWKTTMDIKNRYSSASFLEGNHVVFNIKGNSYRLVVKIHYDSAIIMIKWLGTHGEYSKKRFP